MNIRTALIEKLHQSNQNDLKNIIEEGISSQEETILPGLGVLFELYYNDINEEAKASLLEHLANLLG